MASRAYVTSNEVPQSASGIVKTVAQVRVNTKDGPPQRSMLLKGVGELDVLLFRLT